MKIKIISENKIKSSNCALLIDTIYNNFIDLTKEKNLSHTKKDIHKVLMSNKPQLYLIIINNKIASYLLGEIIQLNDGRNVLYITYIFTSEKYRGLGHGTKLLNLSEMIAKKYKLDGIMLTCDFENSYINDFYSKRGFMPDMILRQYNKYEIMFKHCY